MKNKRCFILVIGILSIIISKLAFTTTDRVTFESKLKFIGEEVKAAETIIENESHAEEYSGDKNNKNEVAVLTIPGTDYSTKVMQARDNKYYLNHDENNDKSRGGTPFLDYRVDIDNSRKLLIYGHNSKYVDMPFKILEKYYDEEFYHSHKYIYLDTKSGKRKYEIFSVFTETSDWSYTKVGFKTLKEYLDHINNLASKSIYKEDIELSESDQTLILQTCSTKREYKNFKKKFLLIIARKVD